MRRRTDRQAGARRGPARCTLWVPHPQTVRMRAQGPQVRVMGARPLGRAIWQRLPLQAWALQCVPRLEKSFHLSLRPTHQSHRGLPGRAAPGGAPRWPAWQRQVPARAAGPEGGAGGASPPECAGQGPQRRAQGRRLVRSPPRRSPPLGRPEASERSTFLAAEGPGRNSRCFILQKPQALHPRPRRGWGWIPAGHGAVGAAG